MTTTTTEKTRKATTPISPIETIREQLLQLKPKAAHDKELTFAGLYKEIRQMLAEKVTQRDILQLLADHGVKLSPTRFKELMQKYSDEPVGDPPRVKPSSPSNTSAIKTAFNGARVINTAGLPDSTSNIAGKRSDDQTEGRA